MSGLGGAMEDDAMEEDDDFGDGLRGLRPPSEGLGSLRAPGAVGGGSARGAGIGRRSGSDLRPVSARE